jgi:hypothetical protein
MKPVVSVINAWSWYSLPSSAHPPPYSHLSLPLLYLPSLPLPLTTHSIVISIFAIVILGVLAILFATDHHSMMDSGEDPENGKTVAATCLGAILVYAGFLVFCGSQAWLHKRQSRGGEVRLS